MTAAIMILLGSPSPVLLADEALVSGGCVAGALGPAHDQPGVVCEDFDTDRNHSGAIEWTRRFPGAINTCDPLMALGDPNDDIIGTSMNGGPTPAGVNGGVCPSSYAYDFPTCHVVPTENDWHLHSPFEGCDTDDSYDLGDPEFASSCAPAPKAHSGFRSLHLGRHLNATDTTFDTYRFRQTSAFVLDPVHLGPSSTLEFWQIIQTCDDLCISLPARETTGGGQVQISLRDPNLGIYQPWERLTPTDNGYDATAQDADIICEFDPGDDLLPPSNETMCNGSSPLWSNIGDMYGTDRTCSTDTDRNDPTWLDCGRTDRQDIDPNCSWVADPDCPSWLENGSVGAGVWARSRFDLSAFSGRTARLRWAFQSGGGWGFGESRSFLEPEPGFSPYVEYDKDDGWYIDDIRITDVLEPEGACVDGDGDGFGSPGASICPGGPAPDCACMDPATYPGAPQVCDGVNNDCSDPMWPALTGTNEADNDGDGVSECSGDCDDTDAQVIAIPSDVQQMRIGEGNSTSELQWADQASTAGTGTVYDVYFGRLSDLRTSGGSFSAGECVADNVPLADFSFTGPDPDPGDGYYFIVRGQNACPGGTGTYGNALRDQTAGQSTSPCD